MVPRTKPRLDTAGENQTAHGTLRLRRSRDRREETTTHRFDWRDVATGVLAVLLLGFVIVVLTNPYPRDLPPSRDQTLGLRADTPVPHTRIPDTAAAPSLPQSLTTSPGIAQPAAGASPTTSAPLAHVSAVPAETTNSVPPTEPTTGSRVPIDTPGVILPLTAGTATPSGPPLLVSVKPREVAPGDAVTIMIVGVPESQVTASVVLPGTPPIPAGGHLGPSGTATFSITVPPATRPGVALVKVLVDTQQGQTVFTVK